MVTSVERRLRAALRTGRRYDARQGAERGIVRAADLRRAILETHGSVDPQGLWLAAAEVVGPLDFSSSDLKMSLRFEDCVFRDVVRFQAARVERLVLRDCVLPGLNANGARISGDLELSGSHVYSTHATEASTTKQAAVWLTGAQIDGQWICVGTKIMASGQRAIHADGVQVGGTVRLIEGFEAAGQVRLLSATIGGSLDLNGIRLEDPLDGLALDLGDANIAGGLFMVPAPDGSKPRVQGQVDMGSTRIGGQCLFRSVTIEAGLQAPSRPGLSARRRLGSAVSAPRLTVGTDITFEGDCRIVGGVDLSLCEVGDVWLDGEACLSAPASVALDLSNARILGNLAMGAGFATRGRLNLTGAQIGGRLSMSCTHWSDALRGIAVNAPSVSVGGDIDAQGLTSSGGGLNFRAGDIGGDVDLTGAGLDCAGQHYWLNLSQARVGSSVKLRGDITAHGLLAMDQTVVSGDVDLEGGRFTPWVERASETVGGLKSLRDGRTVLMHGASVRGRLVLRGARLEGAIDLADASISVLADDVATWPASYSIAGLTYGRFDDSGPAGTRVWSRRDRVAWIQRQQYFDAGAYEQLATVYRRHGYTREAEEVLIAQRQAALRVPPPQVTPGIKGVLGRLLRSIRGLALGTLVGHGYRPARVIYILVALTLMLGLGLARPDVQAHMRAVDPQGVVFTVAGPLPLAEKAQSLPATQTTSSVVADSTAEQEANPCGDGRVRCFNPASFAIETVIPLVSLGQRQAWYPDEESADGRLLAFLLNVCSVLGWLLSSVFVLSFTRFARGA